MGTSISGYDGRSIAGALSSGGVFAAYDWRELVFGDTTGAIHAKARIPATHRLHGFDESERRLLTRVLGWYSDVQSINSEDTVTWSVFHQDQAPLLHRVLDRAFGTAIRPAFNRPRFWRRTRHPDTHEVGHGPEADIDLEADGWRYVVEAKWRSDIDSRQGVLGKTSQLAIAALSVSQMTWATG